MGDRLKRSPLRRVSAKKAARAASSEGRADAAYLDAVRALPCCACGRSAPSEAHHARDLPDHADRHLYERIPGAGLRSSDRDAIPLCGPDGCHRMFHLERSQFHALYGRDYYMIKDVRSIIDGS